MRNDTMIVDGKNAVLGRLSSRVAKNLLKGEDVTIVNAGKIIVTGNPKQVVDKYTARRQRGSTEKGPYFPKNPDAILRRTIRGMLPYKTNRGRSAFRKLRIHIDVPDELKGQAKALADVKDIKTSFVTLEEIASSIGWKRD